MLNKENGILVPTNSDIVFIFKGKKYSVFKGTFFSYSKKFQSSPQLQQQNEYCADFDVSENSFNEFLRVCQGMTFHLTADNIYDLQYLSSYWGITALSTLIKNEIEKEPTGKLRIDSVLYKIYHNYGTDEDVALISSDLDKYIDSDIVPKFPFDILRKIIYTPSMKKIDPKKKLNFMIKMVEHHGKVAASTFADIVGYPLEINEVENILENEKMILQPFPRNLAKTALIESKRNEIYVNITKTLNNTIRNLLNEISNKNESNNNNFDFSESIKQLELAASLGDAESEETLALFYKNGLGVPQSDEKAAEHIEKGQNMPKEIQVEIKMAEISANFDILPPAITTTTTANFKGKKIEVKKNPLSYKRRSKVRMLERNTINRKHIQIIGKLKRKEPSLESRKPIEIKQKLNENNVNLKYTLDQAASKNNKNLSSSEDNTQRSQQQQQQEKEQANQHEPQRSDSFEEIRNHKQETPAESSELAHNSQSIEEIKPIEKVKNSKSADDFDMEFIKKSPRKLNDHSEGETDTKDYLFNKPFDKVPIGESYRRNPANFASYDSFYRKREQKGNITSDHSKAHMPYIIEDFSKVIDENHIEESIENLVKKCDEPKEADPQAAFYLGVIYGNGISNVLEKDVKKSLEYYQIAADHGDPKSMFNIASIYDFDGGDNVPQDLDRAIEWYSKAADLGDTYALTNLGTMYFNGNAVEENKLKAAELFEKAADLGDSDAQTNLGIMYFYGNGVEKNLDKAVELFEKATEKDDADAQVLLGIAYEEGIGNKPIDYDKAVNFYRLAAEKGHPDAQFNLGTMYERGLGTEHDIEKVVEWFSRAAQNGNVDALYNLAVLYQSGENEDVIKKDSNKAAQYFTRAADEGNSDAYFNLGIMAMEGEGMEQSDELALEYFTKAAERGCTDALFHLGTLFEEGNMVEQDIKKAIEMYTEAAEEGHPEAQFNLGLIYTTGAEDVQPDVDKAIHYFQLAAAQGDEDAQHNLNQLIG